MSGFISFPVANQSSPPGCEAKTVRYIAPISATSSIDLDLRQFVLTGYINAIQGVFIDNRSNSGGSVTITCQTTGQTVSCPASSQGFFPLLVVSGSEFFTIASPSGNADVPLFFYNVPMPANVWIA